MQQKFKDKKFIKTKELSNTSRNSFLAIKRGQDESKERKSQIKSVGDVRSRQNYWKRVSEEIQMLEEYQVLPLLFRKSFKTQSNLRTLISLSMSQEHKHRKQQEHLKLDFSLLKRNDSHSIKNQSFLSFFYFY